MRLSAEARTWHLVRSPWAVAVSVDAPGTHGARPANTPTHVLVSAPTSAPRVKVATLLIEGAEWQYPAMPAWRNSPYVQRWSPET
jgi:hypothetical protein